MIQISILLTSKNHLVFVFQVLITDPDQLEGVRARELDITKERIQKILATGVNVVLVSGGIDDLCLKYFVENGAMAVRRVKKADLKRIAKATGAAFLTSLTNMDGEYSIMSFFVQFTRNAGQKHATQKTLTKHPTEKKKFGDNHSNV